MVWVMTGSAGTQSYLDYCGATVIEFEGCREQWWNRIRQAIPTEAQRDWREDHVMELLIVPVCRIKTQSKHTYFASSDDCK